MFARRWFEALIKFMKSITMPDLRFRNDNGLPRSPFTAGHFFGVGEKGRDRAGSIALGKVGAAEADICWVGAAGAGVSARAGGARVSEASSITGSVVYNT